MKRMILLLMMLFLMLAMAGCDDGECAKHRESYEAKPRIMMYGKDVDKAWFWYAVDMRTDIVYIMGGGGHRGYMSVALNRDGTPMTREQLEEMMQKNDEW